MSKAMRRWSLSAGAFVNTYSLALTKGCGNPTLAFTPPRHVQICRCFVEGRPMMNALSRRRFLGTSLLFAGGAVVSACTTDPTGSGSGDAKVTLNHWYHEYGEAGTRDAA